MTFLIEICSKASDGSETILYRTSYSALSPLAARQEANRLLAARKKAQYARVLNGQGELLYQIDA